MLRRTALGLFPLALLASLPACSSDDEPTPPTTNPPACELPSGPAFEAGSPDGHADPFGARAAGQARAGRIADASSFPQPAHGRQPIQDGDFVLINDKISVVVEAAGISDGYARFGGEILAVDHVGDDGRPRGVSTYIETLNGIGLEAVNPESVTVLRDGSDGGEAVVRVAGLLSPIPFLDGSIGGLFPNKYALPVAQDYVLEPGSERLLIRMSVVNDRAQAIDFGLEREGSDELVGFFHYSRNQMVTSELGFQEPAGEVAWVGFDGGASSFAWRSPRGPMEFGLTVSGFALFNAMGFIADACGTTTVDQAEIIVGGPGYDGLREAIRRVDGEAPWREIQGTVTDAGGAPVPGAWIHMESAAGAYLSRARAADDGSFVIHAPPDDDVLLVPQQRGYPPHDGAVVPPGEATAALTFGASGVLQVTVTDAATAEPLPVRVQVVPAAALPGTPSARGVLDEVNGRLHQEFAMTGQATLVVPAGEHRVIITRGYEYELHDVTVTVNAGETVPVDAALAHSVDSTDLLCADFHIHSWFSADSNDPLDHKVKGAIADGLDIPVSSEHEWIADFQPIIEQLGLTKWAFGVPSEELTTFKFGHFGVVPLTPTPGAYNNGAVDWIGMDPAGLFDAARSRPESPILIINHPSSSGFSGYFEAAQYDRDTGAGSAELWSDHFDAIEVFNESDFESNRGASVADWFSMLNHGYKFWAVGSSDTHHLRTSHAGYPRTCIWFGHDDPAQLTAQSVRDGMATGAATVSGGLLMTVEGPGGERPGQTAVAAGGTATFTVTVQAPSWVGADTLETIVNGETISVVPLMPLGAGPGKRFVNQVEVTIDPARENNWVVFHAKGEAELAPLLPGRKPFAVSNPIFLTAN